MCFVDGGALAKSMKFQVNRNIEDAKYKDGKKQWQD
jgi:hypothetical protein